MSESFALFGSGASGDGASSSRVTALLGSPDRQDRLAAYAYLYANPVPARIGELVDAVMVEGTVFGQYWGVRALHRHVQADPAALEAALRRRLEQLASTLDPDTDSADELRQLLYESLD